jgi:hypothetical protein
MSRSDPRKPRGAWLDRIPILGDLRLARLPMWMLIGIGAVFAFFAGFGTLVVLASAFSGDSSEGWREWATFAPPAVVFVTVLTVIVLICRRGGLPPGFDQDALAEADRFAPTVDLEETGIGRSDRIEPGDDRRSVRE